jgi:hypothetical protein
MKTATRSCLVLCLAIGLLCLASSLHAAPAAPETPFQQDSIVKPGGIPQPAGPNLVNPAPPAGQEMIAADEVNEVDSAPQETQPAKPVAVASNEEPAQRAATAIAGNDHSVWDETSLIGKIFIGLGTLLTIASAARMFMA